MGKLLKFTVTQQGVLARPGDAQRDVLTGVVPPDAALYSDPMRRLVQRSCTDCGNRWQQPSVSGACPRCHGANCENVDAKTIYAPRV